MAVPVKHRTALGEEHHMMPVVHCGEHRTVVAENIALVGDHHNVLGGVHIELG